MLEILSIFLFKFLIPFTLSSLLFLLIMVLQEGIKSYRKKTAHKKNRV